jgi:hypothetical protein
VLLRGLEHPEIDIAVEVVGSTLLDGRADRARIKLVEVSGSTLAFIGVEDIISDRMGQYGSVPGGRLDMLEQAVALFLVAERLDRAYLDRRIRDETAGHFDLDFLEREARKARHD